MIDDLKLFSTDIKDWSYNPLLIDYNTDPDTGRKFHNNNLTYQPLKFSTRIILTKLLKYSSYLFGDDVMAHISKICFNGPKSSYYNIVSYTAHIFKYYLTYLNDNKTPIKLTYKAWRSFNVKNFFYYKYDESLYLEEDDTYKRERMQRDARNDKIYNEFDIIINNLENEEMKTDLNLMLKFLKNSIDCGSGISCGLP